MPDQKQSEVAPGSEQVKATASPPPATATPKFELKDGKVVVDGVSYVKASDLIAAKESLTKQLETAQTTHNEAVDKLRLEVSAAQSEVARANAALEEAKQARNTGAISPEEFAKAKKEADEAKTELSKTSASVLDMRRKLIVQTYHIPADSDIAKSLESKSALQLDALEEALKVTSAKAGPGNYFTGATGGGTTPRSDRERARELLDKTPYRGVRSNPEK